MKEALGQQLRQAREEHQLSLEQVSKATLMRVHYLEAMEAGDFEALPSLAQARGFLRTYANYLGLDAEALLGNLEGNEGIISAPAAAQASPQGGNGSRPSGAGAKYPSETQHIFEEIGQKLQQQRERLGLSLEDVEKYTHLRVRYMQALESGSLDDLPSPVQGRGMLKNYAIFLGMDPEPLLLSFAEGLQVRLAVAQQATRPAPRTAPVRRAKSLPGPLRRIFSREYVVVGLLVLALVGFATWGAARIFATRSQQAPESTAPSIVEILLAAPTASVTPSPIPDTPTPVLAIIGAPTEAGTAISTPLLLQSSNEQGVQVYVTVQERAFMRASVDGKIEFEGRVLPGSAYTFQGKDRIEILTGNGAALQVFYNQQDLGPLGLFGQVIDRVFTSQGVLTPTATITPTSTTTSRPSPTVKPTDTPSGPVPVAP